MKHFFDRWYGDGCPPWTWPASTIIIGIAFVTTLAITMPTHGRRCAAAYEPYSAAYERCVDRLQSGNGGVHYVKKIEIVPVDEK